jgi:RNA polymerase sigma factor (TIGR02999 family)
VKSASRETFSALFAKWQRGDEGALQVLMPLVYDELRGVAHRYLRSERADHTLRSTELVHEAYLRLLDQPRLASHPSSDGQNGELERRPHFYAVAARLMREILVDYARKRRAAKRGYGYKIELDEAIGLPQKQDLDVLALDAAMNELFRFDSQQARIVELRFFGGLSIEETSSILKISPATVKRDWTAARAWLYREIARSDDACK